MAANLKKGADKKDDKAEKKGGFGLDMKWILAGLGLVAITMGSVIIGIQLAPAKYTVVKETEVVEKMPIKPGKTVPVVNGQIVNLKGGRFLRFSVALQFVANEKLWPTGGGGGHGHGGGAAANPLEPYEAMMKDKIVLVASRFTAEQLLSAGGKEDLKQDIKNAINREFGIAPGGDGGHKGGHGGHGGHGGGGGGEHEELPMPEVHNVFFTDFVIQ